MLSGRRFSGPKSGQSGYSRPDGGEVSGHFFGQSSFATYALTTANSVVRIDDDVDLTSAGVLACGITTGAGAILNSAQPKPGGVSGDLRRRGGGAVCGHGRQEHARHHDHRGGRP
ncbi:hypothetical protein ACFP47_12890 [Nesterenkonia lacusekhoensis]|uniref:Uncharacterized protein n=1 Tax=Nesterenkonia lacusekhoensis TaxID=150832 RepID=A0ABS4T3Y4_9MICC|nr:hypothetical protein [Nesterenkonia lacusekhoensis]MBP2319167.1 hypothetical protein [Nesterenkonia lacusekhoensis]